MSRDPFLYRNTGIWYNIMSRDLWYESNTESYRSALFALLSEILYLDLWMVQIEYLDGHFSAYIT